MAATPHGLSEYELEWVRTAFNTFAVNNVLKRSDAMKAAKSLGMVLTQKESEDFLLMLDPAEADLIDITTFVGVAGALIRPVFGDDKLKDAFRVVCSAGMLDADKRASESFEVPLALLRDMHTAAAGSTEDTWVITEPALRGTVKRLQPLVFEDDFSTITQDVMRHMSSTDSRVINYDDFKRAVL